MSLIESFSEFNDLGYTILPGVFSVVETQSIAAQLAFALETDDRSVLRSRGKTYGSRDLITLFPAVREMVRRPALREFVIETLGTDAGLVRALFFDKPPDRSWALPWHKDLTIAVKRTDLPSQHFHRPTMKAGIPHVEAPESLLAQTVTLRLHLDAMTSENGPLSVIRGSHLSENDEGGPPVEIHTEPGDVLAMRPLLSHSSSLSQAGNAMHRRVVHMELASTESLPDGYEWHHFHPVRDG